MPRPIVNKPLKTKTESITVVLTQSTPSSSPIPTISPNISSPIKIDDSPPPSCESLVDHVDNMSEKSENSNVSCKEILDKSSKSQENESSDVQPKEINHSIDRNDKPVETSENKNVSCTFQTLNSDINLKKSKSELANIKVANSNGHFVRILSACPGSDPRDINSKHSINTVFLKDGKTVVVGSLSKDIKELTVKDSKELLSKDLISKDLKDTSLIKDKGVDTSDENTSENTNSEPTKKMENISTTPTLVTIPKLVQKSFSLSGPLNHLQSHHETTKVAASGVDPQQKLEEPVTPKPVI